MNIIDTLKGEAFRALNTCEMYANRGDREAALVQLGRAIGLLQALDKLVGVHADTSSLVSKKRRLMDQLDC